MPYRISRQAYAETYGPTTGDRVRLADTDLILEVEKDFTVYGDEVKFCLLYTSPSPRDYAASRMPSSA